MGVCQPTYRLSPELQKELLDNFRLIDTDDSGQIDKEETLKFWNSNFARLNTDEMFRAVDVDHRGKITRDQWLTFWNDVLLAGHTEEEIREELTNFTEGEAWCKFEKHKIQGEPSKN